MGEETEASGGKNAKSHMIAKGSGLWGHLYSGIFGGSNGAAAGTGDGEALGVPSYPAMSPLSNFCCCLKSHQRQARSLASPFLTPGKGSFCGEHCTGHGPSPGPASSALLFQCPHPQPHALACGPSNPASPCLVPTTNGPPIIYPTTHLLA